MRALTFHGVHDVRVDTVPDPKIVNARDAIIKVTSTAICGSDLHLYDGVMPTLMKGDVLGHEFMGEVVETGPGVPADKLKKGDRVVIPFTIACGNCRPCKQDLWSACDNSNPSEKADITETLYGYTPSGLFGYTHMMGGYAGGQAEYVRVPYADVGPIVIPDGMEDEEVLFLSDIFPTGYQAAENCAIKPGDTIAIWGAGPVGLFAAKSAFLLGAAQVIIMDHYPKRLARAAAFGCITLNIREVKVRQALADLTGGRGPDGCIDAVGLESHGFSPDNMFDTVMMAAKLSTDRPHVLREAILACAKGGVVSIPGVYGGYLDKVPMGAAFGKGLTFKMGQTNMHKYLRPLLERIQEKQIDLRFLISHRLKLEEAPLGYKHFKNDQDDWHKVVLTP